MDSAVTQAKPVSTDEAPVMGDTGHRDFATCVKHALPVSDVLSRIGSKWTVLVFMSLTGGPMRFSELKRQIEGVSQKMLTSTLRDLEEDGFVTRKVTPSIPPRVDYALTEMGLELRKPLAAIGEWAQRNSERVAEARERYAVEMAKRRAASW